MDEPLPQMAAILDLLAEIAARRPPPATAQERRAVFKAVNEALWNSERPLLDAVTDRVVDIGDRWVRVRDYDPGIAAPAPALLYAHGGGWVVGDLDSHDGLCRRLAVAGACRVLAVDYRLAPEHPFPAGLDDVAATADWLRRAAPDLGIDGGRIAWGGDSAGANLVFAAALRHRDQGRMLPRALLSIYGVFDAGHDSASHRRFGDGRFFLSTADMDWFWRHYCADAALRATPYASPLRADLGGLPPMFLGAAGLDPLLDDSTALAAKAKAAGVDVQLDVWPGVTHACLQMVIRLDAARGHLERCAAFLRERLA